ncbi:putative methyltransferase [Anoxybacillus ayderensis]|uniref:Putative methyltransferase n=1 Tax=Anoxybacillus ayderensis TaxID=265546 RepID=A0A0D0HRB6_9BACL|nr:site-specific DNA-methyltransferase [Anoxybacillus ayderensis]KIP22629.1 putative methyltransferase [Anoxybacillus ayderensis]
MEKLDGKSLDLVQTNIEALKKLFPEVVTEGKIDFEKLKLILGEEIEKRNERYEFTWHGKTQAMKLAQTPSTGTLRPDKQSSKNWDTTENLYIEGDNLEVLKLLQKSYFGKIKMIYIDPPYNTGKDFVYKDDFRDNIKNYKEMTQQTTKANTETNGRYHTDWLNMMYPRLKLARNLLREDGVIFISIDDHEMANLKKICDEIFGEDNFIAQFVWKSKLGKVGTTSTISTTHEYILCYAQNIQMVTFKMIEKEVEGRKENLRQWGQADRREDRPSMYYPITIDGVTVYPIKDDGSDGRWRVGQETAKQLLSQGFLELTNKGGKYEIYRKFPPGFSITPHDTLLLDDIGTTAKGSIALKKINMHNYFDYPKSVELIRFFCNLCTSDPSIVLDFFSGSATTAHAVMQLNAEDGGNRKFIMVQLPEPTAENSEAYKAGYKNICEIGKERIRRAGEKIVQETGKTDLDIGFKVFTLDSSNVKTWDPDFENLEQTLLDLQNNMKEDRTKEDLLYEILLKIGLPLTTAIEEIDYNGKTIYNVGFGAVLLCLEDDIDLDIVHEMMKHKSEHLSPKVIFKESGFINDSVKINAIQTLKKNGINDVRSV